ncbi:unnamed protein product [Brugia timori]|uniref:Uncharacterized protein n=1 Tax=Brugia timori TaxID=42155 RepID=A0A3P7WQB4_9BILA|nr:unnamed protein product [Brugia timori]
MFKLNIFNDRIHHLYAFFATFANQSLRKCHNHVPISSIIIKYEPTAKMRPNQICLSVHSPACLQNMIKMYIKFFWLQNHEIQFSYISGIDVDDTHPTLHIGISHLRCKTSMAFNLKLK